MHLIPFLHVMNLKEAAFNSKAQDKTGAIPLSEEHHSNLTSQLNICAAKWRMIGTNLGFLPGELDSIQSNPMLTTGAPQSYIDQLLANWLQWAPGDSRNSKNIATLGALQAALRKSGLGRAAAQLTVE